VIEEVNKRTLVIKTPTGMFYINTYFMFLKLDDRNKGREKKCMHTMYLYALKGTAESTKGKI
jgi:hypothetical protein